MSKKQSKESQYPYPSRFGSHSSMVVEECIGSHGQELVKCKDEYGEYWTPKSRIDSGLLDSNRTNPKRLGKLFQGKKDK